MITPIPIFINLRSVIAFFSSRAITLALASSVAVIVFLYMNFIIIICTIRTIITAPPVFLTKSRKVSPVALPIIMLGGSPIKVAVPPTLDARICMRR